jgi:AcrR family transcriptional regulator
MNPVPIPLETKLQPTQARAHDTYELVLQTAGEMLCDIGFEQLTTNAICKRAGLSPPALYRYFPNKYAILKVLGERLMQAQDDVVIAWIDAGGLKGETLEARLEKSIIVQREMANIARHLPGGGAIGRALRAVPMLQQLRFASRDMVADRFYLAARPSFPTVSEPRLRAAMRMVVELGYAASEMVVEEPDRDAEIINREVCLMFALYFEQLH